MVDIVWTSSNPKCIQHDDTDNKDGDTGSEGRCMMSSIGAFIYGASQILFLYNVIATIVSGKPTSEEKVWDGAEGLEWTVPTPAPYHTFETPPKIEASAH